MAKFEMDLPDSIINDIKKIYDDADNIFGNMTKAGADVVIKNVKNNVPSKELANHVRVTKVYKTPTDDGINTKVYFAGSLPFKGKRRTFTRRGRKQSTKYIDTGGIPAEFLATIFEYGTSMRYTDEDVSRGRINKRPFFRKSFNKKQIEQAMLNAQKESSGGILDE